MAAAAAVLEAEFDAVVAALEERQALLQRLAKIQQSITRRAELQDTLDAIVVGAAELLDEPVAGLRLIDADDPSMLEIVSSVGISIEDLARMRRSAVGICQRAQGYHFARPLDPAAFEAMVAPRRRRPGITMRQACPSTRPPSTR